jgi:hypothetical protein
MFSIHEGYAEGAHADDIQLTNGISDTSGTTGMAIARDVIQGEREAEKLARHKRARVAPLARRSPKP